MSGNGRRSAGKPGSLAQKESSRRRSSAEDFFGGVSAVIEGPHEPGTYYLQFANRSLDIYLGGIEFSHDPVGGGAVEPIDESSGGCGCRTAGGGGGLALLLAPLAILLRRRRRSPFD
jgi:MYXO-CTERM domain-containing protein